MFSVAYDYFSTGQWLSLSLLCLAIVSYLGFAAVLTKTDIERHRLPDKYVLPMYLLVALPLLLIHLLNQDASHLNKAGYSGMFLLGIYWLLRKLTRNSLGFGDVKLAGVLGVAMGFFSPINLLWGTLITFLTAGLFSLVLMINKRASLKTHIPFGPFMLLGTLLAMIFPVTAL